MLYRAKPYFRDEAEVRARAGTCSGSAFAGCLEARDAPCEHALANAQLISRRGENAHQCPADIAQRGELGSPPAMELLRELKPRYWFSAHLHCKFAAVVPHEDGAMTRFLALDKCLPGRRFLQVTGDTRPIPVQLYTGRSSASIGRSPAL